MITKSVRLVTYKDGFWKSQPFPHLVIDDFFEREWAMAAVKVFPRKVDLSWTPYIHLNEMKYGFSDSISMPVTVQKLIDYFHSVDFCQQLSELVGVTLFPDPLLIGGGLHQTFQNGFLNIHTDFSHHPFKKNWKRRINLIWYLNENWQDNYGGNLELWKRDEKICVKSIKPIFNRMIIFLTDENSWHGSPKRLKCPKNESRKSIALYYYEQVEGKFSDIHATKYYNPSRNLFTRWVFELENILLGFFFSFRYFLKRKK